LGTVSPPKDFFKYFQCETRQSTEHNGMKPALDITVSTVHKELQH